MEAYVQVVNNTILGEGPHWNAAKQELLYVDIEGSPGVHRFVPSTGEHVKVSVAGGAVTLVMPVEGEPNKYLISIGRDIVIMEWDGKSTTPSDLTKLYSVEPDRPENRFNDGKCDSLGRLWAGTMTTSTEPLANFYKFVGKEAVLMASDIRTSNGLAWNADNTILYYIDTPTFKIDAFDYAHEAGTISNRRTVFDFTAEGEVGRPDGMTIDTDGNLWIGCSMGSQVLHVNPNTEKKIKSIPFPTKKITSVTFGGPNLNVLYVTSASSGLTEIDLAEQPGAGALYQITNTGAKGQSAGNNFVLPSHFSKGTSHPCPIDMYRNNK